MVRAWPVRVSAPVTTTSAVSSVSGWLFMATGALIILDTFLPHGGAGPDVAVVRAVNAVAVAAGLLMRVTRHRAPWWVPHVAVAGGVVLISLATAASGGGTSAVAYACVYCLSPGYAFLCLPPRQAAAHLVVTLAVGVPVLAAEPGVGVAEQVVLWGVMLLLGAVVGWMARALQAAERDGLTGLPNRRAVERALASATDAPTGAVSYAVLELAMADAQSRSSEQVLPRIAGSWAALLPGTAVLARIGAREFGLLVPGPTADAALDLVARLQAVLPDGTAAAGGVAVREVGEPASMLTSRAEAALYDAKRQGPGSVVRHTGSGDGAAVFVEALERREFVVHYQPITCLETGAVVAAEALLRWERPGAGLVPPLRFVGDAERCGAIIQLGEWVLRTACAEAAGWQAEPGLAAPSVTVNASGRELLDPDYHRRVARALADSGLAPHRLVLELVESDYDIHSLHLAHNLAQLRAAGVRTAMDDFGVGYSSLDRLRRSGVDVLKIDKSFVDDVLDESSQAPLVSAILAMGRALGMTVVAEGVEHAAQAAWLRAHGCDKGQGWYFGRPSPVLERPALAGTTHH